MICIAPYTESASRPSRPVWYVFTRDHTVLSASQHAYPHVEWTILPLLPQNTPDRLQYICHFNARLYAQQIEVTEFKKKHYDRRTHKPCVQWVYNIDRRTHEAATMRVVNKRDRPEFFWRHDRLAVRKFVKVQSLGQSSRGEYRYVWRYS